MREQTPMEAGGPLELLNFTQGEVDPSEFVLMMNESDDDFFPTDARPGSEAKIQVLEHRYRSGFPLWHNSDRTRFDNARELADDWDEMGDLITPDWEYRR